MKQPPEFLINEWRRTSIRTIHPNVPEVEQVQQEARLPEWGILD